MLSALNFRTKDRRLEAAKERIIAALGVKVISDKEQLLSVEGKLACQRLAAGVEGRVSRIDAARAEGKLNPGRAIRYCSSAGGTPAGPICKGKAAISAEKETNPNVSTGLAAVLIINWVDLAEGVGRAAGCLNS